MKVVSPSTMRAMDQTVINNYKIPGIVLMENAGREVALAVENLWNTQKCSISKKIVIFCGKGNNGGDGFVAARHLSNMGFDITVFLLANPNKIAGDAAVNFEIIKNMGIQIKIIDDELDLNDTKKEISDASVLVDAIFGTGLKGEIKGVARGLINLVNDSEVPVIAVDVPSGICGETGRKLGIAIKAKQTVTMALPKIGSLLYPAVDYVGKLVIADIGMPKNYIKSVESEAELLDSDWVSKCFKKHPSDAHKGTFGRVFIIAGSVGMTGAASLAATASVKGGAGLVTLGIPESLNDILEIKLTEAMTMPLPETQSRSISTHALGKALEFANKCDTVVLGPGLSEIEETRRFVLEFVQKCNVPMVIDADGLNALAENPKTLDKVHVPVIITPHPGEMARLSSMTLSDIQKDRVKAAKTAASEFNCTVVLKGARTLIATPKGRLLINPTGNVGMATGGSGDVLSGMIGAFLARGMKPHQAAAAGVYLHGLAGDFAIKEQTEVCLTAQDLINYLSRAVESIGKGHYYGE